MPKLTDPSFILKQATALVGVKTFGTGTTQPMLVRGVYHTGEKEDFVVKFKKSPRMSEEACCRELIGNLMAKETGLAAPDPVLIEVSTEFVETLLGKEGYKAAANSIGLNYSSVYLPDLLQIMREHLGNLKLQDTYAQIFVFDVFLGNSDRRVDKPNMFLKDDKVYLLDHELAFGYVMDILPNPKPWEIGPADLSWIRNHYLYQFVRENVQDFDTFVSNLQVFDKIFWKKLTHVIPAQWNNNQINKIVATSQDILKHLNDFSKELNKLIK